jgi:hypothetical protein
VFVKYASVGALKKSLEDLERKKKSHFSSKGEAELGALAFL